MTRISENLSKLEKDVYLRQPSKPRGVPSHSPTVILILGWMGAQLRHLKKVSDQYSGLFPESIQVLVECPYSHFYTLASSRVAKYRAVVKIIESAGFFAEAPSDDRPSILIHIFSNGGCAQYLSLADAISQIAPVNDISWEARSAMILDSCPGGFDIPSTIRGFTAAPAIRNSNILYSAVVVLVIVYGTLAQLLRVARVIPTIKKLENRLNDPMLLPMPFRRSRDIGFPRLHLYSKNDEVVPWTDVHRFVLDGRKRGLDIREEVFEASGHVSMARDEPERYWNAVNALWHDSLTLY